MNRAERRKKVSSTEAKAFAGAAYQEGVNFATESIYASVCMVLHDKFGFGPKRCQKFLTLIKEQTDCIKDGMVSLKDIRETVYEELDIELIPPRR